MFEIPQWGDEVPKSTVSFSGKSKKTKSDKVLNPKTKNDNLRLKKDKELKSKFKKKFNSNVLQLKQNKDYEIDEEQRNNNTSIPRKFNRINTMNDTNKMQNIVKIRKHQNSVAKQKKENGTTVKRPKRNSNKVSHDQQMDTDVSTTVKRMVKNNNQMSCNQQMDSVVTMTTQSINADTPDEILLNARKNKFNENILKCDDEIVLFNEKNYKKEKSANEIVLFKEKNYKKEKSANEIVLFKEKNYRKQHIKQMLQTVSYRNSFNVKGNTLRDRMLEKLKAAQFRYLNEKLYTSSGSDAHMLFQSDPKAFEVYHQGYQQQLKKWPVNPLDVIVKRIAKLPKTHIVADMGCGEASLSKRVPHTVRSFDLVSNSPGVEECDMAHTPLLAASVDVAVYCLALMGTDLTQYLLEANRVLKDGGLLLIAEVESRFEKVDTFIQDVQRLGFKLKNLDKSQKVFFFMGFVKVREPPAKKSKLPVLTLKPCLYKRR